VKDAATTLRRSDGTTTASDQETAEELKQQYQEVFVSEPSSNFASPHQSTSQQHDDLIQFDTSTVLHYLRRLRPDSSPGPDGLHPLLFVSCADVLAEPLSIMFQESYDSGVLPLDWKTANIVPVFKRGDKAEPNNYRLVSLTSVPCKIMEAIIKHHIAKFLEQNNVISTAQHGLLKDTPAS